MSADWLLCLYNIDPKLTLASAEMHQLTNLRDYNQY